MTKNNKKPKIVFFGTPMFSVKILEAMKKANLMPALVITAPDKPKGRKMELTPSPVKKWAGKNKIPIQYDYSNLENFDADLFVVASFGRILPKEILELPKHKTINVHPSLLPKLRGASPIQSAILFGEKETGTTIMLMNEKMDEGPILKMSKLKPCLPADRCQMSKISFLELEKKLAELSGKLLVETIPKWLTGKIKPIPQDHNKATYTKLFTKKDGEIDWSKSDKEIERQIRALTPWPGTYTFWNNKRIIITKASLDKNDLPVGKAGALIIERVKPEGKNEMDFKTFLKNNPGFSEYIQKHALLKKLK